MSVSAAAVSNEALLALEGLARRARGSKPTKLEVMRGGASSRKFFRVAWQDGKSAVGMFHPQPEPVNEIAKVSRLAPRFAFLEVRELLESRGIRVPRLLGADLEQGWFLVEDLGSTLAEHLALQPGEREALYAEAVESLLEGQRRLTDLPSHSVIAERVFDTELLAWEIDHFRDYGLRARGVRLGADEERIWEGARDALAGTIAAWPRGFVHRDYQSRNLMVCAQAAPRLAWIDFQDSLLGPRCYDLVALLGDSYQTFDVAFVERRLTEFARGTGTELAAARRDFFLMMAQRKLKDAGRFIYLDQKRNNPHFLPFFEPTVRKAQAALREVEGALDGSLAPLTQLLDRHFGPSY